jgi:hypothetical protein
MSSPRANDHAQMSRAAREAAGRRLWAYLLAPDPPTPLSVELATVHDGATPAGSVGKAGGDA